MCKAAVLHVYTLLKDYFKPNYKIHTRATRQSKFLHVPAVRTEIAKRVVYYHVYTTSNELSK